MIYTKTGEGIITERPLGTATGSVSAPRCVLASDGTIVCTFIAQSILGTNDFKPMITRSADGGNTWSKPVFVWPTYTEDFSIFGSISRAPSGEFLFYGTRTPIDTPGESFWWDATQGLKANDLVWANSNDDGKTWSDLKKIPMPIEGSAEAPGAMCATREGRLVCCYAPYNTFDPNLSVKRNQVICLWSSDRGASWNDSAMIRFPFADSAGAEAWVMELKDGRLLGTTWHVRPMADEANAYALSDDAGKTWGPTLSTGINGQSTALVPLNDGSVVFLYNQRRAKEKGVWMAIAKPTLRDFGVLSNQRVWATEKPSQTGMVNHENWTNFAFGEPSGLMISDDEILITVWVAKNSKGVVEYVKYSLNA
ncbi:MAG: exo-alpha-sialidase [Chitinophagaceae bacterium]|nr:exo-alpha-sialidase [Chitinophagaceae bacterium]